MDEIINSMLPPREWTEESGNWMQYTAKSPATRLDVISLQENLDARLLDRQARRRASALCARTCTSRPSTS